MAFTSPVVTTSVLLYLALAPQSLCSIALKKGPPQRRQELDTVLARPGEEVKIVCPVFGSPHPIIQWSKVRYYNVLFIVDNSRFIRCDSSSKNGFVRLYAWMFICSYV